MVLSSPNRLAIFVCRSGSPRGLWRFTDSRIEASWLADNGSSTWVTQFTSTSTGQGSANSLQHQLDHGVRLCRVTLTSSAIALHLTSCEHRYLCYIQLLHCKT